MWYNNTMKKTKEKLVNVAGAGIKDALEKQVYEQEKENLDNEAIDESSNS